jgi:hypothetical protein
MKDIVFKKDCEFDGEAYFKGDVIELESIKYEDLSKIWKLNEQGFIEPITRQDFVKFSKSLKNPKTYRKDDINE